MNIYFFTRTRQYQKVKVDEERKTKSIEMLNDTLSKMYDFEDNSVKSFQAYIQGAEGARYSKRRATLFRKTSYPARRHCVIIVTLDYITKTNALSLQIGIRLKR